VKRRLDVDEDTHGGEQASDAIGDAAAIVLQRPEFAVWVSSLLVLFARDAHDAPDLLFAAEMAAQHRQQLLQIDPIRFGSPGAAIHLDAGRIHDEVLNA